MLVILFGPIKKNFAGGGTKCKSGLSRELSRALLPVVVVVVVVVVALLLCFNCRCCFCCCFEKDKHESFVAA